jgi:hypothetical protein
LVIDAPLLLAADAGGIEGRIEVAAEIWATTAAVDGVHISMASIYGNLPHSDALGESVHPSDSNRSK